MSTTVGKFFELFQSNITKSKHWQFFDFHFRLMYPRPRMSHQVEIQSKIFYVRSIVLYVPILKMVAPPFIAMVSLFESSTLTSNYIVPSKNGRPNRRSLATYAFPAFYVMSESLRVTMCVC